VNSQIALPDDSKAIHGSPGRRIAELIKKSSDKAETEFSFEWAGLGTPRWNWPALMS
jgi:hypothetical protein